MSSPEPAPAPIPTPPGRVSLLAIYRMFFWVGLFSFGGGLTAWFHRELVQVRKWMTDDEFFSGYSLAQVLPGVNSTNMAVYIGQHLRGAIGSIVALVAVLSGPFVVVIIVASSYHRLQQIPGFTLAMAGIGAAAVGMLVRLGFASVKGRTRNLAFLLTMTATFVAVGVLQWPLVPVVLVVTPLSIAAAWPRKTTDDTADKAADA